MIDGSLISSLRYAHGAYNTIIILLFLYQGWLGVGIRGHRRKGGAPAIGLVKRHRRLGPFFSVTGVAGFISGLIIVYVDTGKFFVFRFHFITGLVVSAFIAGTYLSSRKIKERDSAWRIFHFVGGVVLICLYFIQTFLGIKLLN